MKDTKEYQQLDQPVADIWSLDWKVGSVLQGDCYRAPSGDDNEEVLVWVSHAVLDGDQVEDFVSHVTSLVSVCGYGEVEYGVDAEGRGFVVFAHTGGKKIDYDVPGCIALRNRYLMCVALVAQMHEAGVSCGNISQGSFEVNARGDVRFIGLLGGYKYAVSSLVPSDVGSYRKGGGDSSGGPSVEADVYALAVIGLELFGAQFSSAVIDVSCLDDNLDTISPDAPPWVHSVLATIIRESNRSLCRHAGEVLKALAASDSGYLKSLKEKRKGVDANGDDESPIPLDEIQERFVTPEQRRRRRIQTVVQSRPLRAAAGGFLACTILIFLVSQASTLSGIVPASRGSQSVRRGSEKTATEVSNALARLQYGELYAGEGSPKVRSIKLAEGSDPTSGGNAPPSDGEVGYVETKKRIERDSVLLNHLMGGQVSSEERASLLGVYDEVDDESKGRLAAAFVSAGGDSERLFREMLTERVRRSAIAGQLPSGSFSTDALFIAADGRASLELLSAWKREDKLSNDEVTWLASFHGKKRSPLFPFLARLVLSRKLAEWPSSVFYEAAVQADSRNGGPYDALLRSATEGPSLVDSSQIAAWSDSEAIKALYAIAASTDDPRILQSAVSGLVNRPGIAEDMRVVIDVMSNADTGALIRFSKLIGVLGLADSAPPVAIDRSLMVLQGDAAQDVVVRKLLELGKGSVVRAVLRVYGKGLHPDMLIQLLDSAEPQVRMDVIPFLKDVTISSAKAKVRDKYYAERDPNVRRVFESELFPST